MSAVSDLVARSRDAAFAAQALAAALREVAPIAVLVSLDLEACAGPGGDARDPDSARILQVAIVECSLAPLPGQVDASAAAMAEAAGEVVPADLERVEPGPGGLYWREESTYVDPLCEIDEASRATHGIGDEHLGDDPPRVEDLIESLDAALRPRGRRTVLCAYNGGRYDGPLLAAELRRAALRVRASDPARAALAADLAAWVLEQTWVDPLAVRRRAEPMDLGGSVRRYLGVALDGAHDARRDIAGTVLALGAQFAQGHATSVADAVDASAAPPGAYDRAGKLVCDEGVDPSAATPAQVRYAIGKSKGQAVADEPGFARWMLSKDFPEETKARVRALLAQLPAKAGAKGRVR